MIDDFIVIPQSQKMENITAGKFNLLNNQLYTLSISSSTAISIIVIRQHLSLARYSRSCGMRKLLLPFNQICFAVAMNGALSQEETHFNNFLAHMRDFKMNKTIISLFFKCATVS